MFLVLFFFQLLLLLLLFIYHLHFLFVVLFFSLMLFCLAGTTQQCQSPCNFRVFFPFLSQSPFLQNMFRLFSFSSPVFLLHVILSLSSSDLSYFASYSSSSSYYFLPCYSFILSFPLFLPIPFKRLISFGIAQSFFLLLAQRATSLGPKPSLLYFWFGFRKTQETCFPLTTGQFSVFAQCLHWFIFVFFFFFFFFVFFFFFFFFFLFFFFFVFFFSVFLTFFLTFFLTLFLTLFLTFLIYLFFFLSLFLSFLSLLPSFHRFLLSFLFWFSLFLLCGNNANITYNKITRKKKKED